MLRDIFVLNRKELDLLMQLGYGDYVYRCTIVAPLMVFAGFLGSLLVPESAQRLIGYFAYATGQSGLGGITMENISSFQTFGSLFFNNFSASFSALVWGLLPFLYLSAFTLGINFYMLGTFAYVTIGSGASLATYCFSIAPHGIFEFPALILFSAAGLFLCRCTTARLRGQSSLSIMQVFGLCVKLLWTVVAPLLLFAAAAECFLTPFLVKLVA